MTTKEFRLGNLIQVYDIITEVIRIQESMLEVHCNQLQFWQVDFDDIENINPIVLTEEWLLRFGFELKSQNSYNFYKLKNGFGIYMWTLDEQVAGFEKKDKFYWGEGFVEVKYVHDLQNLYYCISKQELKYEKKEIL